MLEAFLFVEDKTHELVVGALVRKIALAKGIDVKLTARSARRGIGKVKEEFDRYLLDVKRQSDLRPDLIVVATDANCKGLNERRKEIWRQDAVAPVVCAIPDPHVERWLLADGAAFKSVFGKGCQAPDLKCERDRYKQLLMQQIMSTGIVPSLGGIEYAVDIVDAMDLDRAASFDPSLKAFVDDLRTAITTIG